MTKTNHDFSELFAQLGLPSGAAEIREFLAAHTPLDTEVRLADAPFWTPAQKMFLRESIAQDADWALLVDQLSAALRPPQGSK
ncbi:MAG: DUF2789 domain-containing protein [Gammaproteobacteria bacterium]|uniref:DUF2789 domain-containing protein n=1 Tax=Rhodoferax sp. TaxID=50421 RepID=UPI0017FCF40E|nr:DUF2789 domain-containing protein [Rhodoferax sp.]MBU3899426.1 DUF2789 domain-containing protein [Gammaproteobacteria bacterium]MBA3057273.1 DUF2789 domain-containing protein [Rhodoferax sp.]MBU3996330.1 DUF2789 domain-containing protein [Gammaproteobacteria bacterium]MBU4080681.1 DUF2789 domain-containing protein [Gammaproteobacteria bacterium]MBU4113529.1 DUF2789 domain-containing protein [Gammaproteobacteria bacterium]